MASEQPVPAFYAGNGVFYDASGYRIPNTGVVSVSGTANQISAVNTDGAVVISLPSSMILPGSVTATGNISTLGQLSENGSRVLTGLTAGSGISITGSAPNLTVTNASSGGVTSVSGTANQITVTPTTGAAVVSFPNAVSFPGSTYFPPGQLVEVDGILTINATAEVPVGAAIIRAAESVGVSGTTANATKRLVKLDIADASFTLSNTAATKLTVTCEAVTTGKTIVRANVIDIEAETNKYYEVIVGKVTPGAESGTVELLIWSPFDATPTNCVDFSILMEVIN